MDRPAYRRWLEQNPHHRWERCDGKVVAMAPERLNHTRIKYDAWQALRLALLGAKVGCEAIGDGITVEIDEGTDYEPDAVVNCGPPLPGDALAAANPVVVVEVLSPSTGYADIGDKLANYFSLASVRHCLIVSSSKVRVIHHQRDGGAGLLTSIHVAGSIELKHPGIIVAVEDFCRSYAPA